MLSPELKIKLTILKEFLSGNEFLALLQYEGSPDFSDKIDEWIESDIENDYIDLKNYDFREGEVETNIQPSSSIHYESKSVAARMYDGSWVGWTYWYGGGKYGEPESVRWMNYAYHLECTEEEKLVIVRTFKVKE